jgi:hypothetical protein
LKLDEIKKTQINFVKSLKIESLPTSLLKPLEQVDLANAFSIYKNNYYSILYGCLKDSFEISCDLLSEKVFKKLCYQYIQKEKMKSTQLSEYGAGFIQFVSQKNELSEIPFMHDLLNLEWNIKLLFNELASQNISSIKIKVCHPVDEIWLSFHKEIEIKPLEHPIDITILRSSNEIQFLRL